MDSLEKKIETIEEQITRNKTIRETKEIISEMKKIGIEKLPYSYSALRQFIDPETMKFHYTKHYIGYVDKLNQALSKKKYGDLDLEKIIKSISRYDKTIRNNAGGAFNHALFWNMLTPEKMELKGPLLEKIKKEFGSFIKFKKKFEEVAKDRFGSGWVWLVLTAKNTLKIMSTPNQDNPLMNVVEGGGFPLLGLDLWEHAYYLKYKNKRDEYIVNFWRVVNWDFVSKLYDMKIETKLLESQKMRQILTEGKSESCSRYDTELYRVLFNVNPKVKNTYRDGIDKILKEVYQDKYFDVGDNVELPGVYNLEKEGRSIINKLNTNYSTFCILVNDINKVLKKTNQAPTISFSEKTPQEQIKETERFVSLIDHYKYNIFNGESATFVNIMLTLEEKDKLGEKREQITAAILKRYFRDKANIKEVGKLGSKKDALKGIDLEITIDGKTHTAQVKPFYELIEKDNFYTLKNTANVKLYNTDWMVFQKGKNVLVFNKKPKIVNGNFVFPKDSLIYNIN